MRRPRQSLVVSVPEAAELLGMSPASLYRSIGRLPVDANGERWWEGAVLIRKCAGWPGMKVSVAHIKQFLATQRRAL